MKTMQKCSLLVVAIAASAFAMAGGCGGNSAPSFTPDGGTGGNSSTVSGSASTGVGGTTSVSQPTSSGSGSTVSTGTASTSTAAVCPTPGPTCCLSNTNCTNMNLSVCDTATNRCVECLPGQAAACTGTTSVCSPTTDRCQASCTADGGTCRGAVVGGAAANVCDTTTGACVGCIPGMTTGTGACSTGAPVCDSTTQRCVQCTAGDSTACVGNTPHCDVANDAANGQCVACLVNSDCPNSAMPVCSQTTHACVAGCLTNAQCTTAAAPVCNTMRNACVACATDSDCSGRTTGGDAGVATPFCQAAGAARCVECVNLTDGGIEGCGAGMRCMNAGGAGGGPRCM